MFKSKSLASSIAISLFLSTMFVSGAAPEARAATFGPQTLPLIPPGGIRDSLPFGNLAMEQITVSVTCRTIGPNVVNSLVRAELVRTIGPLTVAQSPQRWIDNTPETVTFSYTPTQADLCPAGGLWLVRVRNLSQVSNLNVEAIVRVTYTSNTADFLFTTNPPGPFLLGQNQFQEREFHIPSDLPGTLKIEGSWATNTEWVGPFPIHLPMPLSVVRVIRPDGSELSSSELGGSPTGYSLGSGMSPVMRATVNVREQDLGGQIINPGNRWTVRIHNPNSSTVQGILLSFKFTPNLCQ